MAVDDLKKFFNQRCNVTLGKDQRSAAEVWDDLLECLFGTVTTISYAVSPFAYRCMSVCVNCCIQHYAGS